jgi:putative PIN family toxin of toxin-antitoxin system
MRVVLDTNVVIAGLLTQGGPPGRIMDLWAEGRLTVAVCPSILEEYLRVLTRPRFRGVGSIQERYTLILELTELSNTLLVQPDAETRIEVIKDDPTDNHFLECALAAKADSLISGDQHLLELKQYRGIAVVSPGSNLKS